MRIVLDTNCLIQSIPRRSPYRKVWDSILSGKNILCVSNEIIEEYAEILQRLTDQRTSNIVIRAIVENPHVDVIKLHEFANSFV